MQVTCIIELATLATYHIHVHVAGYTWRKTLKCNEIWT